MTEARLHVSPGSVTCSWAGIGTRRRSTSTSMCCSSISSGAAAAEGDQVKILSLELKIQSLHKEIERLQRSEAKESFVDVTKRKINLRQRVLIPTQQFPGVNFVGKILGPQGQRIRQLQEDTGAKIAVLGKGSMRDKNQEEELRRGGDAKYGHLKMELHVFVEVTAPFHEVYTRMAHAIGEVTKFLIPEPSEYNHCGSLNGSGRGRGAFPGRGRAGPHGQRGRVMPRGAARGAMGHYWAIL